MLIAASFMMVAASFAIASFATPASVPEHAPAPAPESGALVAEQGEPLAPTTSVPRWMPTGDGWFDADVGERRKTQTIEAEAKSLGLKARGDGAFVYKYADEPFSAVVWPDGRVDFKVRRLVLNVERLCVFVLCIPLRKHQRRAGPHIPLTSSTEDTQPTMAKAAEREGATNSTGDAVSRAAYPPILPGGIQGRFGLRATPVVAMLAFLERTHDFRLALALRTTRSHLEQARRHLPQQLVMRWQQAGTPEAAKAEILALWADVEFAPVVAEQLGLEPEAYQNIDLERQRAAAEARAKIVKFVRRHAPPGSASAFTTEELARFNARPERILAFEPYAEP